jgi:hypothetical protein
MTVGVVESDCRVAAVVGDCFCPDATAERPLLRVTAVWVTAYVLKAVESAKSRPWWC